MGTFPTNEDHGIVDRVARDRAPQAKRWWAKSCGYQYWYENKGDSSPPIGTGSGLGNE